MKHNKFIQLLSNGMMILLILAIPLHGVAAQIGGCDTIINDQAGIFGSNIGQVEAAVSQLQQVTEVRVITIDSYGSAGDLGHYLDQMRQSCPSWQSLNGGMKENLVVFAISMQEHADWIAYGEQWTNPLKENYDRILGDYMDSKFADGDFAGGFAGGINEVYRLLDLKIHPPAQAPIQSVPVQSGPVTIDQREPVDLSGFFRFLIILAIIVVAGLLIYFGRQFYIDWSTEQEKRSRAQQRAKLRKNALTSGISQWAASVEAIETDILALAEIVDDTVIQRLNSMIREAQTIYEKMLRRYNGLTSSAGDPDINGLSSGQYDVMTAAYQEVLDLLEQAQNELAEATTEHKSIQESAELAPDALQAAEKALESARKAVAEMTDQGFTLPKNILEPIEKLVTSARGSIERKRPDLAHERAVEASELAKELTKQVRALPKRREAIEAFIKDLPALIKKLMTQVETGRKLFDEMDNVYPEDALEPIGKNGSESEKRINALLNVEAALTEMLKKQQYDKAESLIENAEVWAEEVDSYMRSITSLKKSLDEASKAMQPELDAAAKDVMKAQAYLTAHKADLDDEHFDALKEAETALRAALKEMDKHLPNPSTVVKLARLANEQADRLLEKAREDTEQKARLRVKAETAMREAERLVSKAEEYIEDHNSDVESNAKANLRAAKRDLATAKDATDLERIIAFAEGAEEKARSAYNEAKQDVENAREEEDDDSSGSSVLIFNSQSTTYNSTPRTTTNTWHAPTSNSGGGGHNFGGLSGSGGGGHNFGSVSKTGGGGHKW